MDDLDQKIREYVDHNYPELAGARLSIGQLENRHFRVIATDQFDVMHTLNFILDGRAQ